MSGKLCILMAYPYMTSDAIRKLMPQRDKVDLLVDSGAFTAWKAGQSIKLVDYLRFLESLPFEPWRYFMLDVIGDPQATWKNYLEMRRLGFDPIPIFTRGEDPAQIERYYEQTDYIAVGGLVGTMGHKGYLNGFRRLIGDRRAHWLGFTKMEFIKAYRPFSVDSSNWAAGLRFGSLPLYMGHGKMTRIIRKQFLRSHDARINRRIERYGFSADALYRDPEQWTNSAGKILREISFLSAVDVSLDTQRNLGTRFFIASSGAADNHDLLKARAALERITSRGSAA